MLFSRPKLSSLVGLDIAADEIRLLQLKREATSWTVENIALAQVPAQAIVDGRIKEVAVVEKIIRALVIQTHTQDAHAAIALPATSVMTQRIKFAAELNNTECEVEIAANLARYLPGVVEELCFDFVNLPPVETGFQEILLVASRQEQLNIYARVARNAGLQLRIVDVDSYALLRAVRLTLGATPAEAVAVIDVSDVMSRFMVFQNQHIIFSHYWEVEDLSRLESAVQRALLLFQTAHKQCVIQQVILSGRIASWRHTLANFFQTTLALTPLVSNPFSNMKIAKGVNLSEELALRLQVCCGLAVRRV